MALLSSNEKALRERLKLMPSDIHTDSVQWRN